MYWIKGIGLILTLHLSQLWDMLANSKGEPFKDHVIARAKGE
jgi:hypothetical protein